MIPDSLRHLANNFFDNNAHKFDLTENQGCGKYTEAFVRHAQSNGFPKVGHLKKNPGQTQWNGHANDAFLYKEAASETDKLYQAVDIIGNAEAKPPYNNTNNKPPTKHFGVDIPRYTEADWLAEPAGEGGEHDMMIPWAPYFGDKSSDKITRTLMYDFSRKPETINPGFGRWLNRCLHSAFLGPDGIPLGPDGALARHRPEWCQALGGLDPNVPVPDTFFPEWINHG